MADQVATNLDPNDGFADDLVQNSERLLEDLRSRCPSPVHALAVLCSTMTLLILSVEAGSRKPIVEGKYLETFEASSFKDISVSALQRARKGWLSVPQGATIQ